MSTDDYIRGGIIKRRMVCRRGFNHGVAWGEVDKPVNTKTLYIFCLGSRWVFCFVVSWQEGGWLYKISDIIISFINVLPGKMIPRKTRWHFNPGIHLASPRKYLQISLKHKHFLAGNILTNKFKIILSGEPSLSLVTVIVDITCNIRGRAASYTLLIRLITTALLTAS